MVGELAVTAFEVLGKLGEYLADPENQTDLLAKAAEVGGNIASAIWDNLVNVWESLVKNLPSVLGLFVSGSYTDAVNGALPGASIPTLPGFATGLDYVPYDNFLARLHEGEMVLTKSQANALRSGAVAGRSVTVNQYIYSEAKSAADLMDEARYKQEEAELLGI